MANPYGAAKAVVLTASIDNEDAIRAWMDRVAAAVREAQATLDALTEALADAPHIAITLTSGESS